MSTPTFWERAEQYPPCLVRLLARHKRGLPLTDVEIANRGKSLSPYEVHLIARERVWYFVQVGNMRAFLDGCGIDFCNSEDMNRIGCYLRQVATGKCKMSAYLRRAPHFKTELQHLIPLAMDVLVTRWANKR
jgi:hypothetical protein